MADHSQNPSRRARSVLLWAISLLAVGCLSFGLGRPLIDQDEGRNAEVGREMAGSGDFVVPTLDGLPYLDKPVLYFAAEALAMKALGPSELAARLPALLSTLATALLVAWFARRTFGPGREVLAALMFLSAPLTVAFSRVVIFDATLTLFVTAAIVSLFLAVEDREEDRETAGRTRSPGTWAAAGWAAMGLGVLTKGPVALVLPLLVVAPLALRRRTARRLVTPAGLGLFTLVVAPWVVAVSLRKPDFLRYALLTETLARVATDRLHRTAPFWIFPPLLLLGAFPWSLGVLALLKRRWRARWSSAHTLALVWIGAPLVLFTLSQSKRAQYVLPLIVPVALLAADLWVRSPEGRRWAGKVAGVAYLTFAVGLGAALFDPALLRRAEAPLRPALPAAALALAAVFLLCGASGLALRRRPALQAVAFGAAFFLLPVAVRPAFLVESNLRSTRSVAGAVRGATEEGGRVVFVETYAPSLSFYTHRRALVVSRDATELRSNYLPAHYRKLLDAPGTTLRSVGWLDSVLDRCPSGEVFAVHRRGGLRPELAARLPLLTTHHDLVFYGPCGGRAAGENVHSARLSGAP